MQEIVDKMQRIVDILKNSCKSAQFVDDFYHFQVVRREGRTRRRARREEGERGRPEHNQAD